ncbi:hypothetical protein MPTK1_1g10850 [Marchantia polymorpha subsp. ruderalis]|uniref:PHD-type domain-containing protein n=2 Tax=Marchantia polymorpha TaxID=3197 RepID=A0AAF6ANT2_MARPO|nr:hypothetical protein MARPO_0014s0141 [Marchantia polymorpha]BBM98102.1 hypothetical protein Mp_1g10850 [Marchantia polymorpha subsp. ruderalis]|eukprot:PTQ45622.1 hypothetical protein MARPO_0014s0141 [Marchantia polymorpha]
MAFHIACPFTCRKICFCTLGTPISLQAWEGKQSFLQHTVALENLLANPHVVYGGETTVEVLVPRLSKEAKKKKQKTAGAQVDGENIEDTSLNTSKRGIVRRKVTVSSIAIAEAAAKADHVKKATDAAKAGVASQLAEAEALIKSRAKTKKGGAEGIGGVLGVVRDGNNDSLSADDYLQPLLPQVVCGLCSSVETVGSEREKRMLPCRGCSKRYHRKCVKQWAEHRDIFNWANWVCGSCRSCEVCKRTGEPNKLMFCKRCDEALHVYCQQPPLKHVPKGPYLCPKHTRCHSCASNVPGSGVSSRWFMSFTTCDACGRLFMKDKYCPVCLKVYRDSEATPMVCCDNCEHWVHCRCDGISDEKFNQFQIDDNLRYKCAACRGDCHKVKNIDDAVAVLWRRRDESDAQQRAELRAAASLPSEEEMLDLCPSSDDEKQLPASSQAVLGVKKTGNMKKKSARKDSKDNVASGSASDKQEDKMRKKSSTQKTILKILSPNPNSAGEISRKPKLIIRASKSMRNKPTRESADDSSEQAEYIDESDLNETLKVPDDTSVKELTAKKLIDVSQQPDRERRNEKKRTGFSTPVAIGSVGTDIDTRTPKSKKVTVLDNEGSQEAGFKTETWTSSSGRSKNRKAGPRGGAKHPGVILDSSTGIATDTADVSTSSADVEQLKEEGATTEDSDGRDVTNDDSAMVDRTPRGLFPLHSWGGHGHSESARRRRMPSSKFRDMEVSAWRPSRGNSTGLKVDGDVLSGAELPQRKDAVGGSRQGLTELRKDSRVKFNVSQQHESAGILAAAEDDLSGVPRKKMKVVDIGGRGRQEDAVEGSKPKVPLRLKIRSKPGGKNEIDGTARDGQNHEEEETSTVKGHRSKRRRPGALEPGEKDDIGLANDNRILQRLGADAVSKRVEVFWPMDNQWYKGTVIEVFPQQAQFALRYDDGEEETLDFGKERVRLLSSRE